MNKDFHYYGTYYAARIAGYSREDAEEIAWAAQMVDDFTEANVGKIFNRENITYTCESMSDTAYHELRTLSNVDNKELQKIRRIWVPFHFLPGNMRNELVDKHGFVANTEKFSPVRDLPDFKCVCAPNSPLVESMIQRIRNNNTSLIRIGIAMHVLADTWAHQMFVGSPTAHINNVSGITENTHSSASMGTPDIGTMYSITYLGHGRAGHLPDTPSRNYQYTPSWSSSKVNVSNPIRFYNAFYQIVDVLMHLKTQNPNAFVLKDYFTDGINFGDDNKTRTIHDRIMSVLSSTEEDQSQQWKNAFRELGEPQTFNFNVPKEKLESFEQEAFTHLNFVMNAVNGAVPGYFR